MSLDIVIAMQEKFYPEQTGITLLGQKLGKGLSGKSVLSLSLV